MKVAIVGSRDFDHDIKTGSKNAHTLGMKKLINRLVRELDTGDYFVTGGATGADTIAETSARTWGVGRSIHMAQWKKYGKPAGAIRNKLIVKESDILFAFFTDWSDSKGTMNCLHAARDAGVPAMSYDAKSDKWYDHSELWNGSVSKETPDFRKILDERRRVIESTAQKGKGRPHDYDMYGHQPGCWCYNGIMGGGLGRP